MNETTSSSNNGARLSTNRNVTVTAADPIKMKVATEMLGNKLPVVVYLPTSDERYGNKLTRWVAIFILPGDSNVYLYSDVKFPWKHKA
ncbi:hypothetical protein HNR39_000246 [Glaciimonas immobilis]|uniref:Uncharacterized protein n=1 Tax=Glaciimonas immobilis TaxID=728004 RepID=A0A840RN65_9BURK|nr:hypothetical protein HAV38_03420 [Glaciimonas immobilis]MBB5198436.1 hypothetical protein [Glaciimonas immobilis]